MRSTPVALLTLLAASAQPPAARVEQVVETIHGVRIADPYRWLENGASPDTRSWVEGQMKHTLSLLRARPERPALANRLAELLREETVSAPKCRGERLFYTKRPAGASRESIYLRDAASGVERVLADPARVSPDENVSIQLVDVSLDGRLLAYGVRQGGKDEQTIRFLTVEDGRDFGMPMPERHYISTFLTSQDGPVYAATISAEGPAVWSFQPDSGRISKIFGDGYGPNKIAVLQLSPDGRALVINISEGSAGDRGEVWWTATNRLSFRKLVSGLGARAFGSPAGGFVYLFTNWNAPRNRIFRIDPLKPQRHFWKLVVPEAPDQLEGANFAGKGLVLNYLRNAATRLLQVDEEGRTLREWNLPALGSATVSEDRWMQRDVYVTYTSFTTPPTVLRFDTQTGESRRWWQRRLPFDPGQFAVRQEWVKSRDGTRLPMFLVHRRDARMDGARPVLLTAYGGFAVSMTPGFGPATIPWLEQGGVLAVPNLRGGGEFGETWHQAGMLERKQNVFDDFIAAAEWLIASGITRPGRIAIAGGSNGGLLVGAAMTQRPALFGAVICGVPLLDMLRYHLFSIARLWVPEYGSAENPAQFPYLLKYSPYHNVKTGVRYPPVLLMSGDSDTRVDPLHARKMTALLQAQGADALLHYQSEAGHVGGKPLPAQIDDAADQFTFLVWKLAVQPFQ